MQLYNFDLSPYAARCRLAIRKKGLEVELLPPPEGGTRSPEFLAINPIGKAPVLVLDDGTAIPESEVIGEYLEDRWPTPALRPESPEARAQMRLLVRLGDVYLMPAMGKLFGQMNPQARDPTVVTAGLAEVEKARSHIEHFIAAEGCAVAGGFSLADCALAPMLFLLGKLLAALGAADSDATPKTDGYWARIQADPDVARLKTEMHAGLVRMMARG